MKGKTKRVLALVLTMLMLFSVLSACGQTQPSGNTATPSNSSTPAASTDNSTPTPEAPFKPDISKEVTLKWMYIGSNNVTDDKAVMEKVNAYLKEKINAKLEMIWRGWGADFDDRVQLAVNSGEKIDIYFTCSWTPNNEYAAMSKKGVHVRLDNPDNNLLEKYAPDLFKSLDPVLADAAKTEGADGFGIYGIPTYKEIAQQYTWDLNMDTLKKYGYTADDIKDFYEFGPILDKIKKGEGKNYFPLNPETAVLERTVNNSDLIDANSLLSYVFDPVDPTKSGTKIVSRYETPEYKKFVEKMHEYYQAGYVNPEMANSQTMTNALVAAQNTAQYAIGTQVYLPGYEYQTSATRKIEVAYKPAQSGIISTTSARGAMHAISTASDNPERALMLLNLVNTDPTLFTMLEFGLEGVHYTKESDGSVKFNVDMRNTYRPWKAGLGNQFNLPRESTDPANILEMLDSFNKLGKPVPILGWAFDAEPVKKEIAALASIVQGHRDPLNAGSVDPATKLPEFISALKANGIDAVVAEAQKQLDAFMAAKK